MYDRLIGDKVEYLGDHNQPVVGIVADIEVGPLTGERMIRVVDFASEMNDDEAGVWIPETKVNFCC